MNKIIWWKPALVIAVLVISAVALYPVDQKLRPGLDLAGGTVLLYEVEVPEGVSSRHAIEQTIAVLRQRVDPYQQRNLVWRAVGSNRIEIQMPAPSKRAIAARQRYQELRDRLLANNLDRAAVNRLLQLTGPAQQEYLEKLAADNPQRRQALEQLVTAHQKLQQIQEPYNQLEDQKNQLETRLAELTDPSSPQRQQLEKQLQDVLTQLQAAAAQLLEARRAIQEAERLLRQTNIEPAEIERVLALPTTGRAPAGAQTDPNKPYNPRQQALEQLIAAHPQHAQAIRELAQAYAEYEKVKGPLDDPNDLIALLRGSGVLEFRIVPRPQEVPDLEQYRQQLRTQGPRAGADKPYRWFVIDKPENFAEGETAQDSQRLLEALLSHTAEYFEARGMIGENYGGQPYLLLANTPDASLTRAQPGWELISVRRDYDERHLPAVGFRLNAVGGSYMAALTGNHLGRMMAIVLDGRVISAPVIQSKIADSGIISGGSDGFSPTELDYLLRTLSAGSLQARLSEDPILIQQIGASFGADNLRYGMKAAIWCLVLVCTFMAGYYLFWGLVADFALLANLLILLGIMAMLDATFTLPGIAGVILTIGMAVDANVLIYERIREELMRGADLRTAVRLGFDKAFSTIIDANLTTLITCLILGYTATADIKGFAITLGIGVTVNLFTGVFCTRVVIDLFLALARPKRLPMLSILIPAIQKFLHPQIDWLKWRWAFISVSLALAVIGIAAIWARGNDFLDIEFRGGTQVQFQLDEGKTLTVEEVRQRLTAIARRDGIRQLEGDRCVVVAVGQREGTRANAFSVATLLTNPKLVSDKLKEAFRDVLAATEPIEFAGMGDPQAEAPPLGTAPVWPVRLADLGQVIHQPHFSSLLDPDYDVSEFLGGVAIVIDQMNPPATVADITQRIHRMRSQPNYEHLGYRIFRVVGLEPTGQTDPRSGQPLYRSLAVLVRDGNTDYLNNPDAFMDPEGLAATEWQLVREALLRDTSLGSISSFSSQISATMQQQAIVAVVLSWLAIMGYIWLRFGNLRYGLGAIIALIHDVMISVGLAALSAYIADTSLGHWLGLEPFHLNLSMIAAVMTLIGFSVNDTIVVFDRIRENRGRLAFATPPIINDSINQTLSRTVLTTGTVFIAVLLLYFLGGPGVHTFAFIMLVGCIVGTYSSIAIASPILLVGLRKRLERQTAQTVAAQAAPAR